MCIKRQGKQYQGEVTLVVEIFTRFCGFLLLLRVSACGRGGDSGWLGAEFCCLLCVEMMKYNSIFNSIKTKAPSHCQRLPLDVSLSSLKREMSGTCLVTGVYIVCQRSRFWILTLVTDRQINQSCWRGLGSDPGLSVCLYGLS